MVSFTDTLMAYANGIGQKVGANAQITLSGTSSITAASFVGALTGNASSATALATARAFSVSGDASTSSGVNFDGTGNVDLAITLASVVAAQTSYGSASEYISLTWDAKGRITGYAKGDIEIAHTRVTDWSTAIDAALSPYLTSATAASTYATLAQAISAGTGIDLGGATTLGTLSSIALATIGPVGAGAEVGSATAVAKVTVDSYGRVTSVIAEAIQLSNTSHVTGLDEALATKAPLASPTFTGTLTADDAHFMGNVQIDGALTSTSTTNISVADSFIDLNMGDTSTTASTGGIAVNRKALAAPASIINTQAKATGPDVRAYVTVGAGEGTGFAADQIVMISGTASNDGFYAVASVSGDDIYLRTVGMDSTSLLPFLHNNLTTDPADAGQLTRVQIDALGFSNGSLWAVEGELIKATASTYPASSPWVLVAPNAAADSALVADLVVVGDVLHNNAGTLIKASNDFTTGHFRPVAVAIAANSSGSAQIREVHSAGGKMALLNFVEAAPAAGSVVYLAELANAGKATVTEPSLSGTVIVELGVVQSLGASNQALVWWNPRVIAKNN